jgi:hypothetical protein
MKLRRWQAVLGVLALAGWGGAVPALAQASLESVVERARLAWTNHDARDLVARSDTVRLRIPGVGVGAAVRAGQAARLLSDYLSDSEEVELALRELRNLDADHAYAEFARRFTVQGTTDLRVEAVFFGFLRQGGEWRLREVRVTP